MSDVASQSATGAVLADSARGKRLSRHRDTIDGYLFLAPFLAVYGLLLVYPFLKGIWISLHDWNLMAVAFNPDAKEFVGLKNYVRFLWGRDMTWDMTAHWQPRMVVLLAGCAVACAAITGAITRRSAAWLGLAALGLWVLLGFHPGEDGRWYDRRFWPAVGNTFVFVMLTVPCVTVIALSLAIALNRPTRAMAVFRTIFFTSHVLSVAVVTLIWRFMFDSGRGMFAEIAKGLGREPIVWLTDSDLAMVAIVIATVWWSMGLVMVLFLAGLQDIPEDRYEAARLDGAGPWALFRHITLPGLRRTTTLVIVLQTIAHFQVFGQPHLMTRGGPNDATQTIVRAIYEAGFRDSELGRAAAMSLFLFAMMFVFAMLQLRISQKGD
jgi:multiple sugar transport system permease protein